MEYRITKNTPMRNNKTRARGCSQVWIERVNIVAELANVISKKTDNKSNAFIFSTFCKILVLLIQMLDN